MNPIIKTVAKFIISNFGERAEAIAWEIIKAQQLRRQIKKEPIRPSFN